jgi:hypothetical protein
VRRFCWQFDVLLRKKKEQRLSSSLAPSETIAMLVGIATIEVDVPIKGNVPIEVNIPVETNVSTPAVRGRDCVVASIHGSLATVLHDCRGQKALFHIVHTHTIHARAFHSLEPLLNSLEPRFVTTSSRFQVLHSLFDIIEALFNAH